MQIWLILSNIICYLLILYAAAFCIKEGVSLLQAALVLVTFGIISAVVILTLRFQIGSATLVKRRKQRFLRKINGVWKVELK